MKTEAEHHILESTKNILPIGLVETVIKMNKRNVKYEYGLNKISKMIKRLDSQYFEPITPSSIYHKSILLSILLHNLGSIYNLKNHHLISYGVAYNIMGNYDKALNNLGIGMDNRKMIATACLEHRKSDTECGFSSNLSILLFLLNTFTYDNIKSYVEFELIDYNRNLGISDLVVINETMNRIYGEDGYAWKRLNMNREGYGEFKTELIKEISDLRKIEGIIKRLRVVSQ